MTREEYERAKQRILDERKAALALMEMAYDAQLRALDLVWSTHGQGSFTPAILRKEAETAPPPPPPVSKLSRRASRISPEELANRIVQALDRLPDPFDRNDICNALGLPLNRGLLYRTLQRLTDDGVLQILDRGEGRRAARYRRTVHNGAPFEHYEAAAEHNEVPREHSEAATEHS